VSLPDAEDVLTYPLAADDWPRTVVIGGLLTLLSPLVLPLFPLYGYVLDVARAGRRGDPEPPSVALDEFARLSVAGLVAVLVALVYGLPALVVGGLTVGGAALALLTGSEVGVGVGLVTVLVGGSLVTVLALVSGYLAVVGVVAYAVTGEIGAAFDPGRLRTVAADGGYAVHWLVGVALIVAAGAVVAVLPIVGALVGAFLGFYAQVAAARLWGRGYALAIGETPDDAPGA
jgi:hypothetical protein